MTIIQSNNERTLPHHFDAACALYGVLDNGNDYRLTSFEEIQSGKMDLLLRNNLAVGSTEFMAEVLKRLGKEDVRLPRNSNRESNKITLGEAKQMALDGKKIFIKPYEIKLFTGFVLDQMQYTSIKNLPDDTLLLAYEPFDSKILSEWRIYVCNHEIVDARNYSGNCCMIFNTLFVSFIITENKVRNDFPVAYTIDVGILNTPAEKTSGIRGFISDNVVIEYNDMWAIGNYGIPNDLYVRLLKNRYFEIIKK